MSEQRYGNNGGFYLFRSRERTQSFVAAWMGLLLQRWHVKGFEEQHALNEVLRWARKERHSLHLSAPKLNDTLFANGKMWSRSRHTGVTKRTVHVIHLNWKKGSKREWLVRDNLWFLDESERCRSAGFDPHEDGCEHNCVPVHCPLRKHQPFKCSFPSSAIVDFCRESRTDARAWHPLAYRLAGCRPPPARTVTRTASTMPAAPSTTRLPGHSQLLAPKQPRSFMRILSQLPAAPTEIPSYASITPYAAPAPAAASLPMPGEKAAACCSLSSQAAHVYLFSWVRVMDASPTDVANSLALLGHFLRHYLAPSRGAAGEPPSTTSAVGVWPTHAAFVVQDPASLRALSGGFDFAPVASATSALARETTQMLRSHGVPEGAISITSNYSERARLRRINHHAASLPPDAWLMIPDVDEFICFPCSVWVRAIWRQLSTAEALSRAFANVTAATYFCGTLQGRLAPSLDAEPVRPLARLHDTLGGGVSAAAVLDQFSLACAFRQYARGVNTHKVTLVRVRDPRGRQRKWLSSHALGQSSVAGRCISTGYVAHLTMTTRTVTLTGAKQHEARSTRTRRDYAVLGAINRMVPSLAHDLCLNATDPRSQKRYAMSSLVVGFEARDRNRAGEPSLCGCVSNSVQLLTLVGSASGGRLGVQLQKPNG